METAMCNVYLLYQRYRREEGRKWLILEESLKFPKSNFSSMKYQPYEMKPSFTMKRVYQWHDYWNGNVYVSFSGGLDSTVLAYIACQAYRRYGLEGKIPLVFSDTGVEFPEIRQFVHRYTDWLKEKFPELDIELVTIRPKHNFKWVCEHYGFPITSKDTAAKIRKLRHGKLSDRYRNYLLNGDERGKFGMLSKKWQYLADSEITVEDISERCCDVLKKEPFKRYVKETGRKPFIGITQDESFRRENQYIHTGCNVYDGKTIKRKGSTSQRVPTPCINGKRGSSFELQSKIYKEGNYDKWGTGC